MKFLGLVLFLMGAGAYGSAYKIIDDPLKAISTRLSLVQNAQKSIYSSKFIFKSDKMGLTSLAMIREKARAIKKNGVKPDIKLIFDSTGSIGIPIEVLLHLEKEGIEVKFFNDLFHFSKLYWKVTFLKWNYLTDRMHDKLLITDAEHVISGGRNIQDSYYSLGKTNYLDREVYSSGKAARKARLHFLKMWESKALSKVHFGLGSKAKCLKFWSLKNCKKKLAESGKKILDSYSDKLHEELMKLEIKMSGAFNELLMEDQTKDVRFIADEVDEKGRYVSILSTELVKTAFKAQKKLLIETPYLIPDKKMLKLFKTLLNRGVKITIITNSLKSTDGLQAFAGYSLYRKILMNLGDGENQMEIYEYQGSQLGKYLHAKSATIDDRYALIGSYNLDPRSDLHNTEVMLLADDEESARQLSASIESHKKYSLALGSNGHPKGGERPYPGASKAKIRKVRFYRSLLKTPKLGPLLEKQL